MNDLFQQHAVAQLIWLPELGIGYYPVTAQPYDAAYWERYRRLDATDMGRALTAARVRLARAENCGWGPHVDVGIGGGAFVEAQDRCFGLDVNPVAQAWLADRNWDVTTPVDSLSFWDSLEHIHDPRRLLALCRKTVLVSMPIYRDVAHVLASKHFRKDEHCWYFTHDGLRHFMAEQGFRLVYHDAREAELGREDIGTFAFRRYGA